MAYPTKRIKDLEKENAKLRRALEEANKRVDKHVPRNKLFRYQLTENQVKKTLRKNGFADDGENLERAITILANPRQGYIKQMDEFAEKLVAQMLEYRHWELEKQPQRALTDALKGLS